MSETATNIPTDVEDSTLPHDNEKKSGKKSSIVWLHFTKFTDESGEARAYCNYCKRDYCANTVKNGTSAMMKHLKKCQHKPKEVGSISPSIVESLICTQDWLRKAKDQINIEETIEDIQKHEEGLKNLSIKDKSDESVTQTQEKSAQTQQSHVNAMDTTTSFG